MICAIDPGLNGAICFLDKQSCTIHDMPTLDIQRNGKNKRDVDAHTLATLISDVKNTIEMVFLERVASMPGQGVSSVFAFGEGFGIIKGILATLKIPYTLVTPQMWKKAIGVTASKDGSRARASQLLPAEAGKWARVKDDGRAEATLIALYGRSKMGVPIAEPESISKPVSPPEGQKRPRLRLSSA